MPDYKEDFLRTIGVSIIGFGIPYLNQCRWDSCFSNSAPHRP